MGHDLIFGRFASEPFVPSTMRLRALDAWEEGELIRSRRTSAAMPGMEAAAAERLVRFLIAVGGCRQSRWSLEGARLKGECCFAWKAAVFGEAIASRARE